MALPPLADITQLEKRLPGGIDDGDVARAEAVLDDASALIRAESGVDWTTTDDDDEVIIDEDNLPAVVLTVCCRAAARALGNPDQASQESIDGYSASYPDVYLTNAEKRLVRRAAGRSGIWTQRLTRGTVPDTDTVYVDTSGDRGGADIPYMASPEPF